MRFQTDRVRTDVCRQEEDLQIVILRVMASVRCVPGSAGILRPVIRWPGIEYCSVRPISGCSLSYSFLRGRLDLHFHA